MLVGLVEGRKGLVESRARNRGAGLVMEPYLVTLRVPVADQAGGTHDQHPLRDRGAVESLPQQGPQQRDPLKRLTQTLRRGGVGNVSPKSNCRTSDTTVRAGISARCTSD